MFLTANSTMEETHRDWESFPAEVLTIIFQDSRIHDLRKFAIVCRAWKNPAQAALYANVTIKNILQLKRFYITMQHSPHLGKKVKTLNFEIEENWGTMLYSTREKVSTYVANILSDFLPNLEELNGINLHTYAPVLNALSNDRLQYLKRLQSPSNGLDLSEVTKYVSSAYLMRDRIEEICVLDDFYSSGDIRKQIFTEYERLYNSLNEMDKLTTIVIQRVTTDEIQVLEYLAESCKSLQHITYYFILPDDDEDGDILQYNNDTSVNALSRYTPRSNLKSLQGLVYPSNGPKVLSYIINKFPGLNCLRLRFEETVTPQFDVNAINELLRFASHMQNFSISGLAMNIDDSTKVIENYWHTRSIPGGEAVMLFCSDEIPRSSGMELGFSREPDQNITVIKYPEANFQWGIFLDFIKNSGEFIGSIQFGFRTRDAPRIQACVLPADFISLLVTKCPNLKSLHLQQCTLELCDYSKKGISKRLSLNKLHFDFCVVYPGLLKQLSSAFSEINQLRLCMDVPGENQPLLSADSSKDPLLEVIMPYTEINHIIIDEVYSRYNVHIKVYAVSYKLYYYYMVGTKGDNRLKKSNESQYYEKNDDKHIYICSLTKPKLDIRVARR